MSESKPDHTGKNATPLTPDFAMHFRAKDESLTEVFVNRVDVEKNEISVDTVKEKGSSSLAENDLLSKEVHRVLHSDSRIEEMPSNNESAEKQLPGPPEYKKMFKNLNELTEKITRTVEGKISEMKLDLNSSRTRILSSKDNSSLSESEDNSEDSKIIEFRSIADESPEKSVYVDASADNSVREVDSGFGFNTENNFALRQRKRTWPIEVTKLSEEPANGTHILTFSENVDIESAVEADENINVDESDDDDEQYFDSKSQLLTDDDGIGGRPPKDGEFMRLLRFLLLPENHKIDGYAIFITFCIFLLPLPSFVRGFLTCFLLLLLWYLFSDYLKKVIEPHPFLPTSSFAVPDYSQLDPLKVPHVEVEEGVWFNEYTNLYDPDYYSVSQTVPVYLEIDKTYLKLSRPKGKISKRATYDERKYKLEFINQRVYDLRHCHITLRPEGILRRRYFSKKFPIFIQLKPEAFVKAVKFKDMSLEEEEETDLESIFKTSDSVSGKSVYGREYLNLFARCNRQKEEWFRKLKIASKSEFSKVHHDGTSSPFEKVDFDPDTARYEEYWQYMSKFTGEVQYDTYSVKSYFLQRSKGARKKKKDHPAYENMPVHMRKMLQAMVQSDLRRRSSAPEDVVNETILKSEQEVQWLNALINRFLFDIFRTPYWLNKMQAKVQRKLASIRLPYYIEALEVIELDLGKVGPRFHRISEPVMDERGLWIDLDMTFDGSVKMILQTQLNLIKLQRGLEEEVSKLPDEKNETRNDEDNKNPKRSISGKSGSKALLLEFAEMIVADKTSEVRAGTSTQTAVADDSDSTESDESDDDDDDEENEKEIASENLNNQEVTEPKRAPTRKSSKKIFRVMESVAQSRYFKTIAETKYVQKAIAGVSATKLSLLLEVKSCIGTLSLNVPPPPNDRIWFGFRHMPKLWMSAQPKVGQRNIGFSHIKHFVERKIMEELKKVIVMPNMDDLLIPIPPDDIESKEVNSAKRQKS